jgi:hypothetical protein
MKKIYLLSVLLTVGLFLSAQNPVRIPSNWRNQAVPDSKNVKEGNYNSLEQTINYYVSSGKAISEVELGNTIYDLQSNASTSNRFYRYEDGHMAAAWTRGLGTSNSYSDRGTGYNYYNGTDWLPAPTTRIETVRAGWPSYAPQYDGEIIVSHHDAQGFIVNRRPERATGDWTQYILPGPAGAVDISWPRIVSTGDNNENIHMLASTWVAYEGQNRAVLYYRSQDGGATWDIQHSILPGMGSEDYIEFSGDTYAWADPKDNNLAFIVADQWHDLFIMKSTDNGENWEKTVIWEHPYPMWDINNPTPADTFYCPDGAAHITFDNNGKLHAVFGISRSIFEEGSELPSWYPFVDGVAYWNEDMPVWTNGDQLNALDPDALYESGNLIGWMQDINENGELDLIGYETANIGDYSVGASSMPQITIDENGYIYVIYTSITEGFDNGTQQYRHIWARGSGDGGQTWGDFVDLNSDILHMLDECVFPTIANRTSEDRVHFIYQLDNEPGLALRGDEDSPAENLYYYSEFDKADVVNVGTKDIEVSDFSVEQNYPNPFNGTTAVKVSLQKVSNVDLKVFDMVGRQVYSIPSKTYNAGSSMLEIDGSSLSKGIYTYTVTVNGSSVSNKMIIK